MKKILYSIILTLVILAVIGCSSVGGPGTAKIVIYTSMYQYVIDSVKKDLQKDFPKYDIEFVYGGTGTLQGRVESERAYGRLGCDILMVAEPTYSIELREQGMLHSFKSKETSNLAFDYDPDGYWYPVRVSNMILAYNPERQSKDSIPNSFQDFANDSRVSGSIAMRSPLTSGTSLASISALRDKYGYEYFDSLARQNIQIEYGSDTPIEKLESGQYKVIMILEESVLRKRQEGSKLEVIYPEDGTIMIPSTIMIINNNWSANSNTGAAEEIADWFLSMKGQGAIVDGWMHSVRTNFPRIPFESKPTNEIRANSIAVNWVNHFHQKQEIQEKFQEDLARR